MKRSIAETNPKTAPKKRPLWSVRLEKARIEAGFKGATAFAKHLGVSQQRYAHYENGKREPEFEILIQICSALRVTPGYILAGEP